MPSTITVTSPAFDGGGSLPARFTCDGAGMSPPLSWSGVPDTAASVAVVVDDPDAPSGTFTHWVLVGLPADATRISEGSAPSGAVETQSSAGSAGYTPACPPEGDEAHHYRFSVYALGTTVDLAEDASPEKARSAIADAAVASGRLVATYAR